MNKFIPLTLASVIVIAMIFAVTPIEYAQTTHAATTIVGADSVTSASIAANTIVSADISNTADITGTQILDNTIAVIDIGTNAVAADELADNAVDTNAIANLAVTGAKIAANTIAVGEIGTAAVANDELAGNAVTTDKILDDTIGPDDVTGSNDAAGLIRFQTATSTVVAVTTGAFTPTVQSKALVMCSAEISEATGGAIVDVSITVSHSGTATDPANAAYITNVAINGELIVAGHFVVTAATTGDAKTITCTVGGTGILDADVIGNEIAVIWFPE